MRRATVVVSLVLLALGAQTRAAEQAPRGKLVFAVTTGLEDLQTLSSSFRHAQVARGSGHLQDVVWLGYGRSVVALDPTVSAVPESLRKEARAAKVGGVRLVACANALQKYGIDAAKLEPEAQVVPAGMVELARLVAEGYAVIRY